MLRFETQSRSYCWQGMAVCKRQHSSSDAREAVLEPARILTKNGTISWISIHELFSWNILCSLRSNDNVGSSVCTFSETEYNAHLSLCCVAALVQPVMGTQSRHWSAEFMPPSIAAHAIQQVAKISLFLLWWQGDLNVNSWEPRGTFWNKIMMTLLSWVIWGTVQSKNTKGNFLTWLLSWGSMRCCGYLCVYTLHISTC